MTKKETVFSHTFGTFFTALKRNIDHTVYVTKCLEDYLVEFRTNKALHCLRLSNADYYMFLKRFEEMQKPFFKVGF